ncbi:hypothetical protein L226DRAFT_308117 [Lentinus tigrinus ALCF2SS1-7]|uniref:Uncharacterized protein n=1 Tax=Lentinus tigrinus ALCF2SS1-6 TaxID=1328759 RepID=A0A5C2S329_9APHY|nr:hypothetical protein L227DRAFT_200207 [Lentinus tigrinus ALCF2SS1-6]RPD69000.1 hypothetical protein L226DRAFT_308117 [Lentinus tigrinus ALCF2SS1-7]
MSDSAQDVTGSHDGQRQTTVTPKSSREGLGFDLFGWDPDLNTTKTPLVDAWLDIDKHLTEDDIPNPDELDNEIEQVNALITRGLARFASVQKSPEQIKDEYPVKDTELPAETDVLADDNHLVEVLDGLWGDLQSKYIASSSSCDPPFHVLRIPGRALMTQHRYLDILTSIARSHRILSPAMCGFLFSMLVANPLPRQHPPLTDSYHMPSHHQPALPGSAPSSLLCELHVMKPRKRWFLLRRYPLLRHPPGQGPHPWNLHHDAVVVAFQRSTTSCVGSSAERHE